MAGGYIMYIVHTKLLQKKPCKMYASHPQSVTSLDEITGYRCFLMRVRLKTALTAVHAQPPCTQYKRVTINPRPV